VPARWEDEFGGKAGQRLQSLLMDLRAHRLHHVNAPGGIDEFENGQLLGPGHLDTIRW